ncbi:MAG: aminotransferase class V-fold PLP-dependent enzyme [Flavobacteriales bacterium]|nr:aminotransferase class V-fold PLP-dependent enzyme [Flavobacteriales bacterium]
MGLLLKLRKSSEALFEDDFFENLRKREFSRLEKEKHVYLDYTGGNLYPESLVRRHFDYLKSNVFGNPHSMNPTSRLSTKYVESARKAVSKFFNANDYVVIFTANASGALHIVGENYPFEDDGFLMLSSDNHNSVNGIREYCKNKGGRFVYSPLNYEDLSLNEQFLDEALLKESGATNKLFAYPAQSNVSGVRHPLAYIEKFQKAGWDVLLDAAAYVPTSRLDLSVYKPDFVSVSFYKIFGFPTGIGCLLVRKDKFSKLHKRWFAGGTVSLVSVNVDNHYLANNHERFENGTVNYLEIPAIERGLDFMEGIGMGRLNERVAALTAYLIHSLSTLKHRNGNELVRIFGPTNRKDRGGNIILNFYNQTGAAHPFEEIEAMASSRMISLRGGCFCNPGIDEVNNCVSTDELARYYTSRDKGDYYDMIAFLGKMRGAIRLSVGMATTKADIDAFVKFASTLLDK